MATHVRYERLSPAAHTSTLGAPTFDRLCVDRRYLRRWFRVRVCVFLHLRSASFFPRASLVLHAPHGLTWLVLGDLFNQASYDRASPDVLARVSFPGVARACSLLRGS